MEKEEKKGKICPICSGAGSGCKAKIPLKGIERGGGYI